MAVDGRAKTAFFPLLLRAEMSKFAVAKFYYTMRNWKLSSVLAVLALAGCGAQVSENDAALKFSPDASEIRTLTIPGGKTVSYTAYEQIYYVTNVEDSTYQFLNFYVPEEADQSTPILLRTYVGGYMASAAKTPSATDASGRALAEGYVVCIPGARGSNSKVGDVYTGRAPRGLLDLKAAVRYLRLNDKLMAGDAEKIFTDGTSAGGAMSSLLGATGNAPCYESYLQEMGAASTRDDVFAAICYCPITDLDHADMAYEWLYSCTNDGVRALSDEQKAVSEQLAAAYPEYVNSLGLKDAGGNAITADNFLDYIKTFIIASAQKARNEGCDIPEGIGFEFNSPGFGGGRPAGAPQTGQGRPQGAPADAHQASQVPPQGSPAGAHQAGQVPPQGSPAGAPQAGQDHPKGAPQGLPGGSKKPQGDPKDDGRTPPSFGPGGVSMPKMQGEFVVDVDMPTYLSYVAGVTRLKNPPAFDTEGVAGGRPSAENSVFGDATGATANFTPFSAGCNGGTIDEEMAERVRIMNPLNFIGTSESTTAPHWYIRHGARDRDTAFPVPVILATKLMNEGYDVDFALPWNRPHSGDYNLDDLFEWMAEVLAE